MSEAAVVYLVTEQFDVQSGAAVVAVCATEVSARAALNARVNERDFAGDVEVGVLDPDSVEVSVGYYTYAIERWEVRA